MMLRQSRSLCARWALLIAAVSTMVGLVSAAGAQTLAGPGLKDEERNSAYLRDQGDVTAVAQVVLRERQARDRGWWDQMLRSYWKDSRVDLSWYHGDGPGFVHGSRAQYERGSRPVHRMFAPVVEINGNKAWAEVATESFSRHTITGKPALVTSAMRLNYRLEKREGEWRILFMAPVYEHSNLIPAVPGETISIAAADLAPYRTSYAVLSYALAQRGVAASLDELGDDRPAELEKFYATVRQWLND